MGLLGRGRGRGRAAPRPREANTWVAAGLRGRGKPTHAHNPGSRKLDKRPKQLEVTGFDWEEREQLNQHFSVCTCRVWNSNGCNIFYRNFDYKSNYINQDTLNKISFWNMHHFFFLISSFKSYKTFFSFVCHRHGKRKKSTGNDNNV